MLKLNAIKFQFEKIIETKNAQNDTQLLKNLAVNLINLAENLIAHRKYLPM